MGDAMNFESSPPWIIKAVKQRELFNYWSRQSDRAAGQPCIDDFAPDRLGDELKEMGRYGVVRRDGTVRFIVESDGARLIQAFGSSGRGRFFEDHVPPHLLDAILQTYLRCVETRQPIYTVAEMADAQGRMLAYERLLLPFFDGGEVVHIITNVKIVSEHGGFEIMNLMRGDRLPRYTLTAMIDMNSPALQPRMSTADDVVEI